MNGPDSQLTRFYGNEDVLRHKLAFPSGYGLAGRLALAMLAMKGAQHFGEGLEDAQAQAAAMNNRFRALEQMRVMSISMPLRYSRPPMLLRPSIGGRFADISGPVDPAVVQGGDTLGIPVGMDGGMVRMASAIGQSLAHNAGVSALAKQAATGGFLTAGLNTGQMRSAIQKAGPVNYAAHGAAAAIPRMPTAAPAVPKPGMWQKSMANGNWKTTVPVLGLGALAAGGATMGAQRVARTMMQENQPADWGGTRSGAPQLAYGVNSSGHASLRTPFITG